MTEAATVSPKVFALAADGQPALADDGRSVPKRDGTLPGEWNDPLVERSASRSLVAHDLEGASLADNLAWSCPASLASGA